MLARDLARGAVGRILNVTTMLPRPVLGPRPVNDRGVALDPQVHALLAIQRHARFPTLDSLGPVRAREELRRKTWLADGPGPSLQRVEDRRIPGPAGEIPVRIYAPRGGSSLLPGLVFFHGGGWVVGDLDSHDTACRQLAVKINAIVVAVDYRLAPEHPFPAAPEDCVAAFSWVHENAEALRIDADRIAVAGDSAGGNLSAVVCQQLRDAGRPGPCFQLLIYPSTDMTRAAASHATFADDVILSRPVMDWFLANYLTDPSDELDPRGSPLHAEDLTGLPPAHVAVAGFDPLRDEGEAYAQALMDAGVPTTLRGYGSLVHGFFNMGGLVRAARWAVDDLAQVTRRHLWP